MTFHVPRPKALMIVGWLLALASAPRAIAPRICLEEIIEESDLIFVGEVIGIINEPNESGPMPFTRLDFAVEEEVLAAGTALQAGQAVVSLRFPGGERDGYRAVISGVPSFEIGERYLIFSKDDGKRYLSPVIGQSQGLFRLAGRGAENVRTYGGQPVGLESTAHGTHIRGGTEGLTLEQLLTQTREIIVTRPPYTPRLRSPDDGSFLQRNDAGDIEPRELYNPPADHSATALPPLTDLCADGYHNLKLTMELVHPDSTGYATFNTALSDWNEYMDVFSTVASDGSVGNHNGDNEIVGFVDDDYVSAEYGFTWGGALGMTVIWIFPSGLMDESDVMFNGEKTWTDDLDVARVGSNIYLIPSVAMHEFGHSWGYQVDECIETYQYPDLSVMHAYYGNVMEDGRGVHAKDAQIVRYNYDDQTAIISITDAGIESYRLLGGYLDPGEPNGSSFNAGGSITLEDFTVENTGTAALSDVRVRFFLSTDTEITAADTQLGTYASYATLDTMESQTDDYTATIPAETTPGSYYVGMIVTNNGYNTDDFAGNDTATFTQKITVSGAVLDPPTLSSPADGATCQATSGTLDWTDVSGAIGYRVQIGTTCGSGSTYSVTSSQYSYAGLNAGTTYYWRVQTQNADEDYGDYSGCFSFTTDPGTLAAPSLTSPANAATCQDVSGTLDWADVSGADSYEVQIGTTCGSGSTYSVTSSQYSYSGLDAGTTYYWRVRSHNVCGNYGSYSDCYSFTTDPGTLAAPVLQSPADEATCTSTSGSLSWQEVDDAAGYEVQIGPSCGSGSIYAVTSPPYDYSGLSAGTIYFWRVRTQNTCDEYGAYSDCFSFTTGPDELAAPNLEAPADQATCQETSGTLDWTDVAGASGFRIQLGTSCGSGTETDVTSSQHAFSGLTAGATYYWRVKSKDVCDNYGDYSACFSFTTDPGAVGTPTLTSPTDADTCQALAGTLDWEDVEGASGYVVRLGTTCGTGTEVTVSASEYDYSGLSEATTYAWQVKAQSACGDDGAYSDCFSFTTVLGSLAPPDLLSPNDADTCQALAGTLDWADVAGAAAYIIQLGTTCGSGAEQIVTSSQLSYEGLQAGTTYHWRVRSRNACAIEGVYSECFTFTTAPDAPSAPTLTSPADDAVCQTISGTLNWADVADAVGYTVQLGTSCGEGDEYVVTGSSHPYAGLLAGTTYYWRVKSRNTCGEYGDYSQCYSFATDPGVLAAPTLLEPADGDTCQAFADTLDWADVAGAVAYQVQLGTACQSGDEEIVTASEYAYADLDPATTYYWRVRSQNTCDEWGDYSSCLAFTTHPGALAAPELVTPVDGDTCRAVSGALAWEDVAEAAGYMVQIGTACGEGDEVAVTQASAAYADLSPGTTCYWRVKTRNDCGAYGEYSDCASFTTAPDLLDPPGLASPADSAACQDATGTLDWDDVAGATGYRVQLGTACEQGEAYETSASAHDYDGLTQGMTYFWRVQSRNACGTYGAYSECSSFTVTPGPLASPMLLSPADSAVCQDTTGTLDWTDVTGAAGYVLLLSTACGEGEEITLTASEYDYEGLSADTTYSWQVKTRNACGDDSDYSDCFTFGTGPLPLAPPTLLTPAAEATSQSVTGVLTWDAVPGAIAYRVRLGAACGTGALHGVTNTRYTYSDLTRGETYYWQVCARDSCEVFGVYSDCFSFTTAEYAEDYLDVSDVRSTGNSGEVQVVFEIGGDQNVEVLIFDFAGRLIRRLWNGTLNAGPQEMVWDGLAGDGGVAASGIYVVRVENAGRNVTRRFLLVR